MASSTVSQKLFLAVSGLALVGLFLSACVDAGFGTKGEAHWYQSIPTKITTTGANPTLDDLKAAVTAARSHADPQDAYTISLFYRNASGGRKCVTTSNTNGAFVACGDGIPVPHDLNAIHVAQLVFFPSVEEETKFKDALFKQ